MITNFARVVLILSLLLLVVNFCSAQEVTQGEKTKIEYEFEEDIFYRNVENESLDEYMKERCKLDLYYPENMTKYQTVVWFHGGGIKRGQKHIPTALQKKGIAVVAVNYRLSPKVQCPAYLDDAAAAVAWTFNNIEKYGGDRSQIFVAGHSAGGYLTSMIGLDKSYLEKYEIDANDIKALIPYSGHTITHFTVREERGMKHTDIIIDQFAPLNHIRKDAPPLVLITGDRELELLGRYEENAYLWRMMQVIDGEAEIFELDGFNHGAMAEPAHHILLETMKELKAN